LTAPPATASDDGVRAALATCLVLAACRPDIHGGDTGSAVDDVVIEFLTPAPAATFTRDHLGELGALTTDVAVELAIEGSPAWIAISVSGVDLATVSADGRATVPVAIVGPSTVAATAYDEAGLTVARAEVEIVVNDPELADCRAWLDLYQVDYALGPDNDGVADPVTATVPINGVAYRYVENTSPRTRMFADCELILSLAKAAPILRGYRIVEVADIGIYNYRCIGGGTPPDCPNGISQHAYAKAIDLAGFTDASGVYASVNDDWVIDPAEESTCAAATEPGVDRSLHEWVCSLKRAGVWNIVLTPNYNASHRDHFHVDLTPNADFLRDRTRVDSGPDNH